VLIYLSEAVEPVDGKTTVCDADLYDLPSHFTIYAGTNGPPKN